MAEVGSYSQQEWGDIVTGLQQGKILLCSFSKAADKHIHVRKEQLKGACCICNSTLYTIALRYMYVHVHVHVYAEIYTKQELTFLPGLVHLLISTSSQAS